MNEDKPTLQDKTTETGPLLKPCLLEAVSSEQFLVHEDREKTSNENFKAKIIQEDPVKNTKTANESGLIVITLRWEYLFYAFAALLFV
jgi:hypothetical protein